MPDSAESPTTVKTKPGLLPAPDTRTQPSWAVILHNDDINSIPFVITTLRRAFHCGWTRAFRHTLRAHVSGRAVVWTGLFETAEFKADQLISCGPDPTMVHRGATPLRVTVEQLAG